MLELNGKKYSKDSFDDYTRRAKVKIFFVEKEAVEEIQIDIYTTDDNKESVENFLLERKTDKVTSLHITYWTTREQDDASTAMIEEWLNEN